MSKENRDRSDNSCCCGRIRMPTIPQKWMLFLDFAFTFGTTLVYVADIVTDIITLRMYWDQQWFFAFGLSMGFIIFPSILLAVLECQFLIKTYGKNIKWGTVLLRTFLNVPFQLTVIWYHIKLSYRYMKVWLAHIRSGDNNRVTAAHRGASMSNLADIDDRANTLERRAFTALEVPVDEAVVSANNPANSDHAWWKQLTREEWLSHLNKMKLTESMLESLPQLLINLYLIVRHPNTAVIQYISAVLSYLSLCGGIVRFDKTRKDNEAERLMVDRTLLHSRVFATRLEWSQILFVSLYKGSFLAARILVFVYFTIYFEAYVMVFIFIHWAVLMAYLVYLWYPTDMHKKTRELVQADYKFRAYMFLSQDFVSVLHNSLVGIFISVRPRNYAFLGQPYCYIFWYYFIYIIENVLLFMLPGVYYSMRNEEMLLLEKEYYVVMVCELVLNILGAVLCIIYYFFIHKMRIYSRNAYPQFAKMQSLFCCCNPDIDPPLPKEWIVCKQAETSEIFYLRRDKLKEYKSGFTTVVRANRKHGRNLECFIDDRGKIFYAPRSRLFKKLPTEEEEEMVNLRKDASRQSLDNLGRGSPTSQPSHRPESQSTVRNERLVGEEPSIVSSRMELQFLLPEAESPPPPLPTSPPVGKDYHSSSLQGSRRSKGSGRTTSPFSKENAEKATKKQDSNSSGYDCPTESVKKGLLSSTSSPSHTTRKRSSNQKDVDARDNSASTTSPNSSRSSRSHRIVSSQHQNKNAAVKERFPESPESMRSAGRDRQRGRDRVRERSSKDGMESKNTAQPDSSRSPSKVHIPMPDRESSKAEDRSTSSHSHHRSDSRGSKNRSRHESDRSSRHKKSQTRHDGGDAHRNEPDERSPPVGQSWV